MVRIQVALRSSENVRKEVALQLKSCLRYLRSTREGYVLNIDVWNEVDRLTSDAVSMHRGSSSSKGHWCKAAIVKAASRADLGTHEFSNSGSFPPANSKNQAGIAISLVEANWTCMAYCRQVVYSGT
jgi:hypothetical protein